jgi:hypothetical protein
MDTSDSKIALAKLAYSVTEFCTSHGISRSLYYGLKRANQGPREMRVRGRVLISQEAAAEWRAKVAA